MPPATVLLIGFQVNALDVRPTEMTFVMACSSIVITGLRWLYFVVITDTGLAPSSYI